MAYSPAVIAVPDRTRAPVSARGLWLTALGLAAATAAVFCLCTLAGPLPLDPDTAFWKSRIWNARAGRLLAAAVAGAGLAAAGAAIQGLLRNPLAEPYILGISSGAGVGVRLGLALGLAAGAAHARLPLLAFAGAAAAAATVYGLARRRGQVHLYSLILSGVVVNLFNGALMMAIYLLADPFRIDEFARWAMGELPDAVDPRLLAVCVALVGTGWLAAMRRGAALNTLGLGDDVARSLGVAVPRVRAEVFAVASLMTAASVALAGPVGFVGLMVPHLCRLAGGPDLRRLVLASGFAGAILLMLAETSCRALGHALGAGRLPVGLLTALIGGPFFIALMRRRVSEESA